MKTTPTLTMRQVDAPPREDMPDASTVTRGSIFMLLSVVFFACHALLIKVLYVSHGISPWQTLWFRFSVGGIVTFLVFYPRRELRVLRVWKRPLLVVRGFFGVLGTGLYYYTIPMIGAGIATLLGCSYVVFSILLAAWLLHEHLTWKRIVWVAITFVGLGLLTRSHEVARGETPIWIFVLAFCGGLCAAIVIISIRKLHRDETTPTIFWAQCSWGIVLAAPMMMWSWTTPDLESWSLLILCGLLSTLGQLFMTAGFRHLPVSIGSGFQMGLPVLATLGGVAFLDERLILLQWFAAAVVVIGTWRTVTLRE